MGEWQPIETAPKDGGHVLLYCAGEIGVGRWTAVWHPDDMQWVSRALRPFEEDDRIRTAVALGPSLHTHGGGLRGPTHWMHLPEKPA